MKSFEDVELWLKEIRANSNAEGKVFLIGNKRDLDDERKVSEEIAKKFQEDNKMDLFMETSAKSKSDVMTLFKNVAKFLLTDYERKEV